MLESCPRFSPRKRQLQRRMQASRAKSMPSEAGASCHVLPPTRPVTEARWVATSAVQFFLSKFGSKMRPGSDHQTGCSGAWLRWPGHVFTGVGRRQRLTSLGRRYCAGLGGSCGLVEGVSFQVPGRIFLVGGEIPWPSSLPGWSPCLTKNTVCGFGRSSEPGRKSQLANPVEIASASIRSSAPQKQCQVDRIKGAVTV